MSATIVPVLSVTSLALALGLCHVKEYYLPLKDQHTKDKERIQALEEEIVRLKREMRICGIVAPPCPPCP